MAKEVRKGSTVIKACMVKPPPSTPTASITPPPAAKPVNTTPTSKK